MPKVIYAWAGAPNMPDIAVRLHAQLDWEPVLWISNLEQHSKIQKVFPATICQDLEDAFLGLPIIDIHNKRSVSFTRHELEYLQQKLLMLLAQMNRFGPPNHFNFEERLSFARRLLSQWQNVISVLKPDIVFFEEAPNSPYMYALYILCMLRDIRTVFFTSTSIPSRSLIKSHIEEPSPQMVYALQQLATSTTSGPAKISPDILEAYNKTKDSDEFQYWYMDFQNSIDKQHSQQEEIEQVTPPKKPFLLRAIRALNVTRWPLYIMNYKKGKVARKIQAEIEEAHRKAENKMYSEASRFIRLKYPDKAIGFERYTAEDAKAYLLNAQKAKQQLKSYYDELSTMPKLDGERFIFFPLHYQPERASNPDGGVFFDSHFVTAMLHAALPKGWKLYIKEHTTQFSAAATGERGRTTQDYDELSTHENVVLVPASLNSKVLIEKSCAVASITGTACWEAAVCGKPGIYFGYPWYEQCPGTHRANSSAEVRDILDSPEKYCASDDEILKYLAAFSTGSSRYVQNHWVIAPNSTDFNKQTEAFIETVTWWHHNCYLNSKG